ncbi:MAG: 30S ribosomal protein S4 [Candidatus Aenigmarchaeota archaeon]|nr:30S ribosomal protein S4 [Candidatus Aenigmarchaeota archaeon]
MGDPKKSRRKYSRPRHPWKKDRIEAEKVILKEYGLKNKREIWQMTAFLRAVSDQAKKLIAARGTQVERERELLIARLVRQGLIGQGSKLDDVLGLSLNSILERRLQTFVVRKGLAKTMNQARQFIVHTHILVNSKVVTRPSYLVLSAEEQQIAFHPQSVLSSADHPVRAAPAPAVVQPQKQEQKQGKSGGV